MFGLLRVLQGPDQGRNFSLVEGHPLVIGRGPTIEGQLRDPYVGRVHCQVQLQGDKVLLSDLGSTGGTQVNGEAVKEHELMPGDLIRIGNTVLAFQWCDADEKYTVEQPRAEWE